MPRGTWRPSLRPGRRHHRERASACYVPFHEYFHGDTGEGLGAGHQTGWTALVALLIQHGGQLSFEKVPVEPASETQEGQVA